MTRRREQIDYALRALILALLFTASVAGATVKEVLLYPGQASITRHHGVSLEAGEHRLQIDGLPAGIQRSTLRVGFQDPEGVLLGETRLETLTLTQARAPQIRELEDQLQVVEDELRELNDQREAASLRLELARRIAEQGNGGDGDATLDELADGVSTHATTALNTIREIDFEKRDLVRRKEQLQSQLDQYRRNDRQAVRLTLGYNAADARDATLVVRYQTRDAGWQSQYEARLDTAANQVELVHLARIHQRTGEDWEDVSLKLSTAQPELGGRLPKPHPWIISAQPQMKAEQMAIAASDQFRSPQPREQATVESRGLTQRFSLAGQHRISDGTSGQTVEIAYHDLAADLSMQLVPSLSSRAYLHASVTYDGPTTLPPARMTLYQDGQYIGESHLGSLAPDETTGLAFGVDDRVTLETVRERNYRSTEGLISKSRVLERVVRHDIANHHELPISLRVFERLPVSNDEAVQVEHHDLTEPYSEDPEERQGVILWKRDLPAGETVSLRYGFTIRAPSDRPVPILER